MRRALLLFTFCLSIPLAAKAQDYKTILDIPPGQTLVNLSATERVEVDQDLLIATLRYEDQHEDPKALQDKINSVMKKALDMAEDYTSIKVSTQQYYVHPYDYDEPVLPQKAGQKLRKRIRVWRGQQGLLLKGKQADDILALTGELQALGLTMNNLTYTLSPALEEETQESLLEAALHKLTAKAERAARALGKDKAELLEINVDMGGAPVPRPVMARSMGMHAEATAMSPPVAQPGQTDITLTVSARAMLK